MTGAAVLLAVDQDPDVLESVERPLRDRYARDYRIVCVSSSSAAMEELNRLAEAGEQVALVLAGQWLEAMTGSELLGEVRRLHPHARRALLVPWGWDRATGEAVFGQAISGFLLEWAEALHTSPHTIHIVAGVVVGEGLRVPGTALALRPAAQVLSGRLT